MRSAFSTKESAQQSSERTQDVNCASDANSADATTSDASDATPAPASTADAEDAEEKSATPVHDDATSNSNATTALDIDIRDSTLLDDSESDEEDDDVLVVLELADFKNHPIFDDYASVRIEVRRVALCCVVAVVTGD